MENRNLSNIETQVSSIEPTGKTELLRNGLRVAAKRGITRRLAVKSAELAERRLPSQLSRAFVFTQVRVITTWIRLAEWGSFGLMLLLGISGLWLTFNHNDNIFATFLLALAVGCFFVWRLVRKGRRYAEQQVLRGIGIFQQLVLKGEVPETAWPQWFRQWRKTHR